MTVDEAIEKYSVNNRVYVNGTAVKEKAIRDITSLLSDAQCDIISIGFQDNDTKKPIVIIVRNPEDWGKKY